MVHVHVMCPDLKGFTVNTNLINIPFIVLYV